MLSAPSIAVDDPRLLPWFTQADADRIEANAPDELLTENIWVCAAREPKETADGTVKSSKRPINPKTGVWAKSNNPSTWGTYEQACGRARRDDKGYGICAIGVNLQDGPLVGLDFDHVLICGSLLPEARELLVALPRTYTEVSPSGDGLRLFFIGELPAEFRGTVLSDAFGKGTQLECYDGDRGARYLTVTGNVFEERDEMVEVTEADLKPLVDLQERVQPARKDAVKQVQDRFGGTVEKVTPSSGNTSAAESIEEHARNGKPFFDARNYPPGGSGAQSERERDIDRAEWGLLDAQLLHPNAVYNDTAGGWFRVLAALVCFGLAGLRIAIQWSRRGDKFVEGEIEQKWSGINGSSINSLFGMFDDARPTWRDDYRAARSKRRESANGSASGAPSHEPAAPGTEGADRRPSSPLDVIKRWGREGPLVHQSTGWPDFDEMTRGGLVYGMVAVFVGAPDGSKTLAQVVLADHFAKEGILVGILAVDEDEDGLMTRLMQRREISRDACEMREPDQLGRMEGHAKLLDDYLRFFDASWSIEDAADRLAQEAQERGLRAAFMVDSLQTVHCREERGKDGLREQVTLRMMALKQAAARHRMIVVPSSEMARVGYKSKDAAKEVNDMALGKESGSIEYQAKVLISLRVDPNDPDRVRMKVVKNKLGRAHGQGDDEIIALKIDRANQTLIQDYSYVAPPTTSREDGKREKTRVENLKNAAIAAVVLADRPGLAAGKLRAAVKAMASVGSEKAGTAVEVLGDAVRILPDGPQKKKHYLQGDDLATEILLLIPEKKQAKVKAAVAPEGAKSPFEWDEDTDAC